MSTWLLMAVLAADSTHEWRFDVSLDGRPIGEHRFVLRGNAGSRVVTSEAHFRVRVLFLDAYRYEHRAHEAWRGDCLEHLDAQTRVNGRETRVVFPGAAPLADCVQTFAYWNPRILESRHLLNPQTGEYVDIKVLSLGRESIGGQPADRYRLLGMGATPLRIDLWYTPDHDWVALESQTQDGRRLRYARK